MCVRRGDQCPAFLSKLQLDVDDELRDLPPGVLAVDRAGFDVMESSVAVFRQAACLLRQAIAAQLHHRDLKTEACIAISTW